MLLTISTTHRPATDLGFLLHKNPDRLHEVELAFGKVLMAYPEAGEARCTFAMTLDVDPVALVRGKSGGDGLLDQYVNDRPYAASSFLSVAIARALNTAFAGRSKHRQDLAETALPLEVLVTPVPSRGRDGLAARLFEPLGYQVSTTPHLLDEKNPGWGDSPYVTLTLAGEKRLRELLTHLYVLLPVLDNSKHYYVAEDEVEKLLAKGEGWLETHPERDFIVGRYLKRRSELVREALARLAENQIEDVDAVDEAQEAGEQALETPLRLNDLRIETVAAILERLGAKRVVDLGCGDGRLLRVLLKYRQFTEIVGVDASLRALEIAERRLKLDRMPERQRERLRLLHGALTYRDRRLEGYDADRICEEVESNSVVAVIPARKGHKVQIRIDDHIHGFRNRVERCFNKLKNARRLATRNDKTADSYLGFIHVAALRLWTRYTLSTAPSLHRSPAGIWGGSSVRGQWCWQDSRRSRSPQCRGAPGAPVVMMILSA